MSFAQEMASEPTSITVLNLEAQRLAMVSFVQSQVRLGGDIGGMTDAEREVLIVGLCTRLQLNMIGSKMPIEIIRVKDRDRRDEKQVLYFNRYATDQLADRFGITRTTTHGPAQIQVGRSTFAIAKAKATTRDGREEEATGMVPIDLDGDPMDIANAFHHAETKAKRRATLSILGLAFLDESEFDTIRYASAGAPSTGEHAVEHVPADDSQFANRETVGTAPRYEPTPLDRLRDDLDQHDGPVALEQAIGIWLDHERDIPIEDVGRASDIVRKRLGVPMSSSAFAAAVTLAKHCEKVPGLRAIRNALAKATTPDELVIAWRALAPDVAVLDAYTKHLAQKDVLFEAVRRIRPGEAHPRVWFDEASASFDARAAGQSAAAPNTDVPDTGTTATHEPSHTPPAPAAGPVTNIPRRAPRI